LKNDNRVVCVEKLIEESETWATKKPRNAPRLILVI
jgi:hypothetical protein